MAQSDPAPLLDQLAKLQTQIILLQRQNTDLQTRNVRLGEELEQTKSELRETQALLGQAVVRANQQPQNRSSTTISRSPSLRYTPPVVAASPSRLKRARSPTLEYVDPLPPLKKGMQWTRTIEAAEPEQRSSRRPAPPCTSSIGYVKESPHKPIKLEFAPTVEVLYIDDSDAEPDDGSQTTHDVAAVQPTSAELDLYDTNISRENIVEDASGQAPNFILDLRDAQSLHRCAEAGVPHQSMHVDSDPDDPNVSQDEVEIEGHNARPPSRKPECSKAGRLTLETVRRSPRFSSMASFMTMSALTPLPSTPEIEDEPNPEVDGKPKRGPKREPKREPKLESSTVLSSITSMYLPDAQPFTITPGPIGLEIPRAFLRLAYGGCDQRFVQYIPADRNPGPSHTITTNPDGTETRIPIPKDTRRMVFPMLRTNPLMPRTPGAPGLVFTSRQEILHDSPWTLFFKTSSGKEHAVWLYLGEYKCELVDKLTPAQFKAQPVMVQRSWARLVVKRRQQECYAAMRARIALRAVGLIPLENKEREQELIRQEVKNIQSKKGKGKNITIEQVLNAFENGDEAVSIIRMKCVKYDHVFANDVVAQYDDYPTMVAAADAAKQKKKQIKQEKQRRAQKSSTSGRTGSRKRSNTNLNDDDDDDDDDEETDEEDNSDDSDAPEEFSKLSTKERGQRVVRDAPAAKSKSRGAPSMASRPSGTSSSAQPGSSRSRRPTSVPAVAFIDGILDGDDGGEGGHDVESEDAFENELSESERTWRASHPLSSTPARSQSLRPRKLSQKVLDSAGNTEH